MRPPGHRGQLRLLHRGGGRRASGLPHRRGGRRRLVGDHQAPGHRWRGVGRHGDRPAALRDRRPPLPQHRRGGPLRHHLRRPGGTGPGADLGGPRAPRPRGRQGLPQPAGRLAQLDDLRAHRARHRGEGGAHPPVPGGGPGRGRPVRRVRRPAHPLGQGRRRRSTSRPPPSCGSRSRTPTPTGWAGSFSGAATELALAGYPGLHLTAPPTAGQRLRRVLAGAGPGRLVVPRGGPRRRPAGGGAPHSPTGPERGAGSSTPPRTSPSPPTPSSPPRWCPTHNPHRRASGRRVPTRRLPLGTAHRGPVGRQGRQRQRRAVGPLRRGVGLARRLPHPRASSVPCCPRPTTWRSGATPSPTCRPSTSWWWACWAKGWPPPPAPTPRPRAWASTFGACRVVDIPVGLLWPDHADRGAAPMDFIESDELQMLREAVGSIASKFGHEYYVEKAHADERTDELWNAVAEPGFLGVNVPEEYGGGGGGITELAAVAEELAAAGLPAAGHRGVAGHLRHHHRQVRDRGPEAAVAPPLRHRRAQDGLRHHRARRRLELPQPVADRHQGRRHLPAQRLEVLHLRRRRVRGHPGGDPVGRGPRHRPRAAVAVRGGHRHPGTRQAGAAGRDHRAGEAVHPVLRQRRRSMPTG